MSNPTKTADEARALQCADMFRAEFSTREADGKRGGVQALVREFAAVRAEERERCRIDSEMVAEVAVTLGGKPLEGSSASQELASQAIRFLDRNQGVLTEALRSCKHPGMVEPATNMLGSIRRKLDRIRALPPAAPESDRTGEGGGNG